MSEIVATAAGHAGEAATRAGIFNGIWALVILVAGGLLAGWRLWIKQGPVWKQTELDGDMQLRKEMRDQLADMQKQVGSLTLKDEDKGRRLTIAETRISQQDSQIGQLRFLLALMNTELERVSPGNPIAHQVRVMMDLLEQQATGSHNAEETGIMADMMSKLCVTKGPGE